MTIPRIRRHQPCTGRRNGLPLALALLIAVLCGNIGLADDAPGADPLLKSARARFRSITADAAMAVAAFVAFSPVAARADDQDVIDYRERIMKTLDDQVAALGQILSGATPDDQVVSHLEVIALTASTALKSFEPKVQGGESKPEVWTNWKDFETKMKDFQSKTALAAKTAKEQGKDAALTNILDALRCKDCHDIYRTKK